ncbi:response regulator [Persicimonas caeni]|uniref:Response regulator n=1 Tax=Persicimonas caeni TaxID=2292766 RepID=A0A4Y6PXS1_PERCE|nr:response regulator [Persicimonas caeni]QDG53116.1 response regulator [Persicimonas caeni]QED34338.1 response regulator [Persicimonas caeni]
MRTIRILIIDDDKDICEYMQLLLSQSGYEVTAETDARAALELLKEEEFHVVILDIMMPELNGMELLERIRDFDSDIAIIIFTGYPSVDTAVTSMKYNVSDYIKKPFDVDEFNQTLEKILREKGLLTDPEEQLLATIGKNIRRMRKDRNLTLKQMSRRTGLSVSLLSQIERAESSASVSSLYKLARALDVKLTQLFGDY